MDAINSLARDIYNFTQGVKKGNIQEGVPFLSHANGKAYIIVAEKEKKHTFLRFLNKTKINVYEAGGKATQKERPLGSPKEAVAKGLLSIHSENNKDLFYTVSTEGAKLRMEFEAKQLSNEEAIGSRLRESIPEFAKGEASSPEKSVTVPQENPKPKNRPPVTFLDEPPATPPPTVTSTPRELDPLDIQTDESRRGVLDELKERLGKQTSEGLKRHLGGQSQPKPPAAEPQPAE
ncbi:MAG: hypothetical protein LBF34_05435 [Puniceicoccales bacterium]|jgi:hypothetical protein|nr:hypothetical protein [Puniceicoccales bacterium]